VDSRKPNARAGLLKDIFDLSDNISHLLSIRALDNGKDSRKLILSKRKFSRRDSFTSFQAFYIFPQKIIARFDWAIKRDTDILYPTN